MNEADKGKTTLTEGLKTRTLSPFEKWFAEWHRSGLFQDDDGHVSCDIRAAFRAGMLAAADIAKSKIKCRSIDHRRHWERDRTIPEIVSAIQNLSEK